MQSEAVSVRSSRETPGEDATQILVRNADTIVLDLDPDPIVSVPADAKLDQKYKDWAGG